MIITIIITESKQNNKILKHLKTIVIRLIKSITNHDCLKRENQRFTRSPLSKEKKSITHKTIKPCRKF